MTCLEKRHNITGNLHAHDTSRKASIQWQIVKRDRDFLRRTRLGNQAYENKKARFHFSACLLSFRNGVSR
jgi:hypothetical protein